MGYDQRRMISGTGVGESLTELLALTYYPFDSSTTVGTHPSVGTTSYPLVSVEGAASTAVLNTSIKKNGASSLQMNGDQFGVAVPLTILTALWRTIEFWLYIPSSQESESIQLVHLTSDVGSTYGDNVYYSSGELIFNNGEVSSTVTDISGLLDTWIHVAAVQSFDTKKLYVNGQLQSSASPDWTFSDGATTGNLCVSSVGDGGVPNVGSSGTGYIDDLRITQDEIYSGNFTPPSGPLGATAKYKATPHPSYTVGEFLFSYQKNGDQWALYADGYGDTYTELI